MIFNQTNNNQGDVNNTLCVCGVAHQDPCDLHLALLCRSVYQRFDQIPDGVTEIGGLGPYCRVHQMPDCRVFCFRGSSDAAAWLEDFDCRKIATPFGCVHEGFYTSWLSIRSQVQRTLGVGRVIFTGHSYGAALATIAASAFPQNTSRVVTFGCPRVGDSEFARSYALTDLSVRYVYRADPVPLVPPILNGFRHVVQNRWYDGKTWRDGYNWTAAARIAWETFRSAAANEETRRLWMDHHIDNYIAALN